MLGSSSTSIAVDELSIKTSWKMNVDMNGRKDISQALRKLAQGIYSASRKGSESFARDYLG